MMLARGWVGIEQFIGSLDNVAMAGGFGHLFQNQAASYAAHRPTYPAQLYDLIYSFAGLKSRQTALDIATGSGQAANVLAKSFQKVRDGLQRSQTTVRHLP